MAVVRMWRRQLILGVLVLGAIACAQAPTPAGGPTVVVPNASQAWLRDFATAQAAAGPPQAGSPVGARLLIPSIKMAEDIQTVSIAAGLWDLASLHSQIGWLLTTGDRPGGDLAMAFVGHVTIAAGVRGPLTDLWKTSLADEIIYRAGGTDYIYSIQMKNAIQPDDVQKLYVKDGQRLILVTCTDWNYVNGRYSERLLVQAELVRTQPSP
jgi:LPXTG-site transpeptidase (sortase) family protein